MKQFKLSKAALHDQDLPLRKAMNVKGGLVLIHEALHVSTVQKPPVPNPPVPNPTPAPNYRSGPGAAF